MQTPTFREVSSLYATMLRLRRAVEVDMAECQLHQDLADAYSDAVRAYDMALRSYQGRT